ncbi:MAG TPA: energy transducer TonB, partial [Rhodanobacteraceae bacterium]|nr:energy transducer TonB [Rhodanobacteraceae bacterium]
MAKLIPIAVIAIVVVIGLYFFLSSGSKAPAPATKTAQTAPAAGSPAAGAPGAAAEAPPVVPDLTPEQLLKEAGAAFREQRFVAPPGNNALEYYLKLLEKQPNNQTAKDALREMFPFATGAVETTINAGGLDEATRVINLLSKADPSNYTLTILRSKLDAKKKQVDRDQAVAAAAATAAATRQTQQQAAAAAPAAPAPATAAPAPAAATAPPPTETAAAPPPAPRPANNATASATPAPAPAAAAAGGETRAAEVVKTSPPDYPPDAVRKHQEGWVEVEFTVMPDGSVANATVVNANPARIFNSAALRAVERWTFKPRTDNGTPTQEKMRRRIEF